MMNCWFMVEKPPVSWKSWSMCHPLAVTDGCKSEMAAAFSSHFYHHVNLHLFLHPPVCTGLAGGLSCSNADWMGGP